MCPELFRLPFINVTVKSYGLMMVIGFLCALWLMRRLSRSFLPNPQIITDIALYALIAGVIGARLFYVIHYPDDLRDNLVKILYIWEGGLEFYGGIVTAFPVILLYLFRHKLPVRKSFDVLAVGLMLALAFGRIGCFLNGCCYGKPTDLPCGIRFPYNSFAYNSQVNPDLQRNRPEPQMKLPDDYFSYIDSTGYGYLKPFDDLTAEQQQEVTSGKYQCLAVHPTELYSSANALLITLISFLFWRRSYKAFESKQYHKLLIQPGTVFSIIFILYGITRFLLESVRDDNPYEFDNLTISQNISIAMIVVGIVLLLVFEFVKTNPQKS